MTTPADQPTATPATPAAPLVPVPQLPPPPVVTRHEVTAAGKRLAYTVSTGMMPFRNAEGVHEANVFVMAYTLGDERGDVKRPVTFVFNGGPGSSSVWLHLGGLGPKRVRMEDEGWMPQPPFELVDNDYTWLDRTDLVFIDPVGTGYSKALTPELAKQFHEVEGDIASVGEIIRLWLSRNGRWTSPVYLAGESYGTTRAAGLAGHLVEKGIALNGVILISMIFNFLTHEFHPGNDLPATLFLPTYTATAWYHQRLPSDLQKKALRDVLREVEEWAAGPYAQALFKGDSLAGTERTKVAKTLARYTGLGIDDVEGSNLRIDIHRFCKALLRDQRRTVGRLDSRYIGIDSVPVQAEPEYDPSLNAIRPPYTSTFNQYVRQSLGYESDDEYQILNGLDWSWGSSRDGYPNTSEPLRQAFAKNPYMKIFVALGYYDLATPYWAALHTLDHLGLDPSQRDRIVTADYESGHMVYLRLADVIKLEQDVEAFYDDTLPKKR
jgi:carboxypeptidase C (cathepsin A)